jgi:L,D-peptidoglycan transpeptidase YkuD (ErfK/YbiS/YcfS/YnhG family)
MSPNLGRLIAGTSFLATLAVLTAGCAAATAATAATAAPRSPSSNASRAAAPPGPRPDRALLPHTQATASASASASAQTVPTWASALLGQEVPATSGQAVIVRAPSMSSTTNTVTSWTRTAAGWREMGTSMPGHNGERGWSAHRTSGDLQTPTGVYSLTAAGGRLPNPGTSEPYEHNAGYFRTNGRFLGHSTVGVFDYVVAIDFNRVPGSPVSSTAEPKGEGPGGGIWLHVDNGAATLACVTVSKQDMVTILRWLDPSQHPVIVLKAG